jgi:hypothetical protein
MTARSPTIFATGIGVQAAGRGDAATAQKRRDKSQLQWDTMSQL